PGIVGASHGVFFIVGAERGLIRVLRIALTARSFRRLAGGYAPSVQEALSARSGGGLAAAWERGVQAGSAGEPGELLEGLRHARPERAEIRAFRRRQGNDGRAA